MRQSLGAVDVFCLRAFVSACEQHNNSVALAQKINPVARAGLKPKFLNAIANGPGVAEVTGRQSLDPVIYAGAALTILEGRNPILKGLAFDNLRHEEGVYYGLHNVNCGIQSALCLLRDGA